MAFLKYARAQIVKPHVEGLHWRKVITASNRGMRNVTEQASKVLGEPFDPSKYLLTHATIMASVQVEEVPNADMGKITHDGKTIHRKYSDYRISADTDKYINNNLDAWSKEALLKSYKTFIGAHNFVEHVQIEDLSKGRIIDAVPRDIGDSIYIDILVATNRKHKDLIESIESGKMSGMSMGCSVDFTICSYCGNVASDETQMCEHIKYQKGNVFYDEKGGQHRIAELCGHKTIDPTGAVNFVEASWVAVPAFRGAVARNILSWGKEEETAPLNAVPEEWGGEATKSKPVLSSLPTGEDTPLLAKVAFLKEAGLWDDVEDALEEDEEDGEEDGEDGEESEGNGDSDGSDGKSSDKKKGKKNKKEDPTKKLKDLENDVYDEVVGRVKNRIKVDLSKMVTPKGLGPEDSTTHMNDTIIKEGSVSKIAYVSAIEMISKTASDNRKMMSLLEEYNKKVGVNIEQSLYTTALKLGSDTNYGSLNAFHKSASFFLGIDPSPTQLRVLIRLSKLLRN